VRANRYLTGAVILLAAALRLAGIDFGLPLRLHPDEPHLVGLAQRMLGTGDLNPHFFHWPALQIYLVAASGRLGTLAGWVESRTDFLLTGRILSAAMGTATVAFTMAIADRIWRDRAISLLTGVFIATALLHVRCSHYATIDVAATFWLTFGLWWVAVNRERDEPVLLAYFAAGLAFGLAVASKYNTVLIIPVVMVWSAYWSRSRGFLPVVLAPTSIVIGAVIAFVATNPYSLLDAERFASGLSDLMRHYNDPIAHPRNQGDSNLSFNLYTLFAGEYGGLALSMAAVGLGVLIARERRLDLYLLAGFPLLTYLYLSFQMANFARNLIPLIPFLAVASAHGTAFLARSALSLGHPGKRIRDSVVFGVGLLACLPGLVASAHFDALLIAKDTRETASEWLAQHLPTGSRVALGAEYWANPTIPHGVRSAKLGLPNHPLAYYRAEGFDYLIMNSISYDAYVEYPDRRPEEREAYAQLERELASEARLCAEFEGPRARAPINDELPNPRIRIFALNGTCPDADLGPPPTR